MSWKNCPSNLVFTHNFRVYNGEATTMSIEKLVKMFERAEKTDSYKKESFKIDVQEELLAVLSQKEIRKILGADKAEKFMSGNNITPTQFIVCLMDVINSGNLHLKFEKKE
jgi:hypothetical protein